LAAFASAVTNLSGAQRKFARLAQEAEGAGGLILSYRRQKSTCDFAR
jgi:hypothetical protein